jgi:hypothetical protein
VDNFTCNIHAVNSASGLNGLKRDSISLWSTSSKLDGFHFGFCQGVIMQKPLSKQSKYKQNWGKWKHALGVPMIRKNLEEFQWNIKGLKQEKENKKESITS